MTIGADSNIQDGCTIGGVITGFPQQSPTTIGEKVTVGHGAVLSGCTVENSCLIGMGSTLTPGCKVRNKPDEHNLGLKTLGCSNANRCCHHMLVVFV